MVKKSFPHDYSHQRITAHVLRRTVHLFSLVAPWIYYHYGQIIAAWFGLNLPQFVWICIAILLFLESLRLYFKITIFGQRDYERRHISAFIWAAVSMALVLLYAPGPEFGYPIVISFAIGDPLLGELRHTPLNTQWVILIGLLVIFVIWLICSFILATPLWLAFLMAPIIVAAEWPCLKWIDDNALMQLIPLAIILIIFG